MRRVSGLSHGTSLAVSHGTKRKRDKWDGWDKWDKDDETNRHPAR